MNFPIFFTYEYFKIIGNKQIGGRQFFLSLSLSANQLAKNGKELKYFYPFKIYLKDIIYQTDQFILQIYQLCKIQIHISEWLMAEKEIGEKSKCL